MKMQRKPKTAPKPGQLSGLRRLATGFHEMQFGNSKPERFMEVPAKYFFRGLPQGAVQKGNYVWIPVPLKKNPKKAYRKWVGRKAMDARRSRPLLVRK